MMTQLLQIFGSKRASVILLALNIATSFVIFLVASKSYFPDQTGYVHLGESFGHGTFSSWYFLPTQVPETLRTWGYPYFLFLIRSLNESLLFVKIIQYLFYLTSLWLCLQLIEQLTNSRTSINIFLLLAVINIQIPYYTGLIAAEALCIFFTLLYFYFLVKQLELKLTAWGALLWGLTAFINFQLRPAFIVIPVATAAFLLIRSFKSHRVAMASHLLIFAVGLMPFAFWNLKHHGVFKFTPLQGGAGVTHIGYWAYLLPANYKEYYLWSNNVGDDIFMNLVAERSEEHAADFEEEWAQIRSSTSEYLSAKDSVILSAMAKSNPGMFVTYNSEFTKAQEKLLWHYTFKHIKERPFFFFKTRLISACRVWFTGINRTEWRKSDGLVSRIKALTPFLISFTFAFGGIIYIAISLVRNKALFRKYSILLGLILIWGLCHSLFAIQARYGVPMHLIILLMVACISTEQILSLEHKPTQRQRFAP
ncbi:hypothetical protein WBG78_12765 [Chryseolinea sp. T2]|uniref:hypothetical protein n=1 Tax=Chryseolinea sp. T2 TaxID=3129255 RepID=UPI00307882A5